MEFVTNEMKCAWAIFIIFIVNRISGQNETPIKTVAVIGAGTSGLTSAKYSIAQGYDVTIYEQNEQLGGIWVSLLRKKFSHHSSVNDEDKKIIR